MQVGPQHTLDVLRLQSLEAVRAAVPVVSGVVDEDVEATEPLDGSGDDLPTRLAVDEVAGHEHGGTAGPADPARGVLRVGLLLGEIADRDVGALTGVSDRHGAPDAGVAAGDERLEP